MSDPAGTDRGSQQKRILFLCTGNSCRSQMAEGWARALRAGEFTACSAGLERHGVNPLAVQVMAEAGVDISGQQSNLISEISLPVELLVTVCDQAHEQCPILPGAGRVIHHGFSDPPRLAAGAKTEAEALAHYRLVRDQIRDFIASLQV
ncbi:MAG: arsenate reductase ArsC [Thermodesulfobacteriota bacterium]